MKNYWTFGTTIFTTWEDKEVFQNVITTGQETSTTNYLYTNEPEGIYTADGQKQEAFLESSEFDTTPPSYGAGDNIMYLDRIVPDFTINDGGIVTLKMKLKNFPNGEVREKGPFTVTPTTQFIRTRARSRQAIIRISTSTGGTNWRLGSFRMDVTQDGKRVTMADYPRFPRITPNMENSSTTFTTSQATSFAPAQTQTISFLDAGGANAFSDNALNQMETWADTLNDKLSADQVKIRNSVQQDQFGSISIRGRLRLNNDLSNPDTPEPTPVAGQMRFNTATNKFQGYDGTAWRDFH